MRVRIQLTKRVSASHEATHAIHVEARAVVADRGAERSTAVRALQVRVVSVYERRSGKQQCVGTVRGMILESIQDEMLRDCPCANRRPKLRQSGFHCAGIAPVQL